MNLRDEYYSNLLSAHVMFSLTDRIEYLIKAMEWAYRCRNLGVKSAIISQYDKLIGGTH